MVNRLQKETAEQKIDKYIVLFTKLYIFNLLLKKYQKNHIRRQIGAKIVEYHNIITDESQQNDEVNKFRIVHRVDIKLGYALKVCQKLEVLLKQHFNKTLNENSHNTPSQLKSELTPNKVINYEFYEDYRNKFFNDETSEIKENENVFRKNIYNIINEEFEKYKLHMSSNGKGNGLANIKNDSIDSYLFTHAANRLLNLCINSNFNDILLETK